MEQPITVKREELYQQVWCTPMMRLAKQYDVSGNRLATICKKLEVPVPPRGYWARKTHGYSDRQPPLPKPSSKCQNAYSFKEHRKKVIRFHDQRSNRLKNLSSVPVPKTLIDAHPLVQQFNERVAEKETRYLNRGRIPIPTKDDLSIQVSPKLLCRALRIMNAILKYAEKQGWKISTGKGSHGYETLLLVDGEDVAIELAEKLSMQKRVRKTGETYFWGGHDWVPTGFLSLRITNTAYSGLRQTWNDGNKKTVEEHLGRFVLGLHEAAVHLRQERLEREESEKRHQEEQQRREEVERQQLAEANAVKQLEATAEQWERSCRIKDFLRSLEDKVTKSNPEQLNGPEFQRWLVWAHAYADKIDPIG